MRLRRTFHSLFRIGAEYLISELLLLLGHDVIQILEGGYQFLHALCVVLGELLVGLQILHRIHRGELLGPLHERLVHVTSVLAHHLSKLVPLGLLGRGDVQPGMQLF